MSIGIDILTAAEDLEVTQEEVENVTMTVFSSAVVGMMLGFMVLGFAKATGMSKKDQLKYEEMAEKL